MSFETILSLDRQIFACQHAYGGVVLHDAFLTLDAHKQEPKKHVFAG